MKDMIEKMNEYAFLNEKPTYYRVKKDLSIEYIEPSFVLELAYFGEDNLAKIESSKCVIKKNKKIKRNTKLEKEIIVDRLFRGLINRDKYHILTLANELMLRDKNILFDILYKLSYIAEDENKLIKTYLFEYITDKVGYNEYLLKNLINYFVTSSPRYMDMNDKVQMKYFYEKVSKLYILIYNRKYETKLDIKGNDNLSDVKKIIFNKL